METENQETTETTQPGDFEAANTALAEAMTKEPEPTTETPDDQWEDESDDKPGLEIKEGSIVIDEARTTSPMEEIGYVEGKPHERKQTDLFLSDMDKARCKHEICARQHVNVAREKLSEIGEYATFFKKFASFVETLSPAREGTVITESLHAASTRVVDLKAKITEVENALAKVGECEGLLMPIYMELQTPSADRFDWQR